MRSPNTERRSNLQLVALSNVLIHHRRHVELASNVPSKVLHAYNQSPPRQTQPPTSSQV